MCQLFKIREVPMKTKTNKILLLLLGVSLVLNLTQYYFSSSQKREKDVENAVIYGTYASEETSLILLLEHADEGRGIKGFTLESYGMDGVNVKDSGSADTVTKEVYKLCGSQYYVIWKDTSTIELLDIAQNTCTVFEKKDDTLIYGAIPEGVKFQ